MASPYRVLPPDSPTTDDDALPRQDRRVTSALLWAGGLFHAAGAIAVAVGLWCAAWSGSALFVRFSSTEATATAGPGAFELTLPLLAAVLSVVYYRSAKAGGDDVWGAQNLGRSRLRAVGLFAFVPVGLVLGAIVLVLLALPAVRARFTRA